MLACLAAVTVGVATLAGSANAVAPLRAMPSETLATPVPGAGSVVTFLWEADGSPNFPLDRPTGAAIDPQGNLWVTDGANDRFVIFSPDGVALEAWGTSGSGEGEFTFACRGVRYGGVAFDATGNIYVADAGNQRIQKFSPDRTFLTSWPSAGIDDNPLLVTDRGNQDETANPPRCPVALTVDGHGHVVVSDRNARAITVYDSGGRPRATGTEPSLLPHGVAVDGDGNIWVADTANRVLKFSPQGNPLMTWDRYGTGPGELNGPMGIAVDAQGRVFVTDSSNRIQVFSADGQFLGAWGSHGAAAESFDDPVAVVLDAFGHVYLIERYGPRVQAFRLVPPLAA